MLGLVGIAIEYTLALFLPVAAVLSYLYLASLRALLLNSRRAKNAATLLGMVLLWLSAIAGPITFLGALLVSVALFSLVWWPRLGKGRPSIREALKALKPSELRERFKAGCATFSGCLIRYLLSWPAGAVFAVTLQGFLSPLVMFVLGYETNSSFEAPKFLKDEKLAGLVRRALRVIMTLVAWGFAVLNVISNVLMPRWLIIQERIVAGEVKGLPLTARLLSTFIGREASYVYGALVLVLALYTAYRAYQYVSRRLKDVYLMTVLSPFIAFAVSANKLGEPLTSVSYAIGMTLALKQMKFGYGEKLAGAFKATNISVMIGKVSEKLGKAILEYQVPLGPLAVIFGVKEK